MASTSPPVRFASRSSSSQTAVSQVARSTCSLVCIPCTPPRGPPLWPYRSAPGSSRGCRDLCPRGRLKRRGPHLGRWRTRWGGWLRCAPAIRASDRTTLPDPPRTQSSHAPRNRLVVVAVLVGGAVAAVHAFGHGVVTPEHRPARQVDVDATVLAGGMDNTGRQILHHCLAIGHGWLPAVRASDSSRSLYAAYSVF